MATPALRCLRFSFPKAQIDLTGIPYVLKIVEGAPWFDTIIPYSPNGEHKGITGLWRYLHVLRNNAYDLAIVLPNSFNSALLSLFSGAKRRVGYNREGRGLLLTDAIPCQTENGKFVPQPMVEYYLQLCEKAGAAAGSRKTELFVDSNSELRAEELFAKHAFNRERPVVAVNPGAAYGSSKLWNPECFARVCDLLIENENCDVAILGGPNEKQIAREIAAAACLKPANLAEENVPLDLLKSIIKRCDLLITVDSGPRHFAVAFDKPVVVLMGPTDPRYTNCNLDKTTVIRAAGLDCAPCHIKKCPANHECMTRITPEMVIRAVSDLLRKCVRTN